MRPVCRLVRRDIAHVSAATLLSSPTYTQLACLGRAAVSLVIADPEANLSAADPDIV